MYFALWNDYLWNLYVNTYWWPIRSTLTKCFIVVLVVTCSEFIVNNSKQRLHKLHTRWRYATRWLGGDIRSVVMDQSRKFLATVNHDWPSISDDWRLINLTGALVVNQPVWLLVDQPWLPIYRRWLMCQSIVSINSFKKLLESNVSGVLQFGVKLCLSGEQCR